MSVPNWYELCECGCGKPVNSGRRFVLGHANRRHPHGWMEVDCGFSTLCWLWRGEKTGTGYAKRGEVLVYREMWEEKFGSVPKGLELDHLCRSRACVNPEHLEPVTHAENMRRSTQAKLSHEQAARIRSEQGSLRSIARKYGVSHVTVLRVQRGEMWA